MSWIRSIFNALRPGRKVVGTDLKGNTYIEVISRRDGRVRREVLSKMNHEQYEDGSIPIEWEAWIRGKRDDPPTHEELIKNIKRAQTIKERADILEQEEQERILQLKDNEKISTTSVGHASANVYEKNDLESTPSRAGDTFRPGAWVPGSKSPEVNSEEFEPEGWSPPKQDASK